MSMFQSLRERFGGNSATRMQSQRLIAPSLQAPALIEPYVVVGPFRSSGAVGQAARLTFEALPTIGRKAAYADITSQVVAVDFDYQSSSTLFDFKNPGSLIVHAQPQYHARALEILGSERLQNRRIIGYWSFEQASAPASWQALRDKVHEIWVPSRYCKQALSTMAEGIPVHVVPHPLQAPKPSAKDRYDFGLPENAIVVFMTFSMDANLTRKNPWCAIEAFKSAFGDDARYHLVIKVRAANLQHPAFKELAAAVQAMPNAKLVTAVLSAADNWALMQCADIILCPSRAEGFGLVQAEALWLGKALVCTGYSGPEDFVTSDCARLIKHSMVAVVDPLGTYTDGRQKWAEPDVDHTAQLLYELASDTPLRGELGQKARAQAEKFFGPATFRSAIAKAGK